MSVCIIAALLHSRLSRGGRWRKKRGGREWKEEQTEQTDRNRCSGSRALWTMLASEISSLWPESSFIQGLLKMVDTWSSRSDDGAGPELFKDVSIVK
ncbi:hypothetical protein CY35_19G044400 [Sphagnum magellanicum]|nr:hypothetical protein CY35_19G044400 [Sphagnum magellanicum]